MVPYEYAGGEGLLLRLDVIGSEGQGPTDAKKIGGGEAMNDDAVLYIILVVDNRIARALA